MSVIIKFVNNISNDEQILIEIQGGLTHTIENKFNYMFLGKLHKNSEVKYIKLNNNLGQLYFKYRKSSDKRKESDDEEQSFNL